MANFISYIKESFDELKNNVSWPTWKELQSSSILVLVASIIIALIVFVMDFTFGIRESGAWKGLLGYYYELFN